MNPLPKETFMLCGRMLSSPTRPYINLQNLVGVGALDDPKNHSKALLVRGAVTEGD